MQGFREYLKDQNNDGEVKQKYVSKQLVLLPIYDSNLNEDQFSIPQALTPLFNEQSMSQLKSYQASFETDFEESSDIEDLTYYLEWCFYQTKLHNLVSTKGESENIMKIVMKELFNFQIFNWYCDNNSWTIINSGVVLKFTTKSFCTNIQRLISKWQEASYYNDQVSSFFTKLLSLVNYADADYSYSTDSVEDSLYSTLHKAKSPLLNSPCLQIKLTLASKKDKSKEQAFKIIKSMDEIRVEDNIKITFGAVKDSGRSKDNSLEAKIFQTMYKDEIEQIEQHIK